MNHTKELPATEAKLYQIARPYAATKQFALLTIRAQVEAIPSLAAEAASPAERWALPNRACYRLPPRQIADALQTALVAKAVLPPLPLTAAKAAYGMTSTVSS